MRTPAILLTFLTLALSAAAATDALELKATRKTVERHTGASQTLPGGTTRYSERDIVYEVSARARSTKVPPRFTVQWVILIEAPGGAVRTAGSGESAVEGKTGAPTVFETEPVVLRAREWQSVVGQGGAEDDVYGYALRALDPEGNLLAESFSASKVKGHVVWPEIGAKTRIADPRPIPPPKLRNRPRKQP